jgi:hypothetical protein
MITVTWGLFKWDATWLGYWAGAATFCTAVSGVIYIFDGIRQLSASPSSAASPKQ